MFCPFFRGDVFFWCPSSDFTLSRAGPSLAGLLPWQLHRLSRAAVLYAQT